MLEINLIYIECFLFMQIFFKLVPCTYNSYWVANGKKMSAAVCLSVSLCI